MELILIRHAESLHNIEATESLDSSLSNNGFTQMDITSRWLKDVFCKQQSINQLIGYTSPLLRCLQTSRTIAHNLNINFKVDYELREFSSTKQNKISPSLNIKNRKDIYDFDWIEEKEEIYFKEESLEEFVLRIKNFYSSLNENEKYLIVSHGSVCRCLHALATNSIDSLIERYSNFDFEENTSIKNCGITFIKDNQEIFFSKIIY